MTGLLTRLKRTEDPALRHVLLRTRGYLHYATHGHLARRRAVERYFASTQEAKLHIGAGPHQLPGWLNTDLISGDIYLDITRRLPFEDGCFAYAFGEHIIEHLSDRSGSALLAELHRVLTPGGVLRLVTPDLRKIIALYEDANPVISREEYTQFLGTTTGRPYDRPAQLFNDYTRLWGHQWIYDEEDLSARLRAAGFTAVVRRETGESEQPALAGLERHGGADWVNHAEAMCLEATKA
jgi:predicted SAM-dependent methyltransferase